MSGNKHFLDELDYLKQVRARAAREHWDLARFLAAEGSDPDVERLFEGFAFLTGRLREKLDDEFPELIQSVLGLWWPHYLRPVPAMSILEFSPVSNAFSSTKVVDAGTEVQSKPVDGTRCRFRTARRTVLHPITLQQCRFDESRTHDSLVLSVDVWANGEFADGEARLRLYLNDELPRAADLYRYLLCQTRAVEVVCFRDGETVLQSVLRGGQPRRSAYDAGESLLPETSAVAAGYLELQAYFCFPQGGMFVDMPAFDQVASLIKQSSATSFELRFHFDRHLDFRPDSGQRFVRLNCTPIVNLFSGTGRPIVLRGERNEYPLVVESDRDAGVELYSVDSCQGFKPGEERSVAFHRFESFAHRPLGGGDAPGNYYRMRVTPSPSGDAIDTYLSFVGSGVDEGSRTVGIELTCTNGNLPIALDPGEISVSTTSSPEYATFANLTRPTRRLRAPLGDDTLWQLVASLSLNYAGLLETESLRTVLDTYDFLGKADGPAGRRTRRILDALVVERSGPGDRLYRGLPVRGIVTAVSSSRGAFQSLGLVYVFGEVLDSFLGSFAGINSFHELSLTDRDSDETFKWPPRAGTRSII